MDDDRSRLIDAAWVVLDRSGWEGLKVDLVVTESGVSTRSFYRHFRSKNELLVVLLEDEIRRAVANLAHEIAAIDDPAEQLVACIQGVMDLAHKPSTAGRTKLFLSLWWGLAREFPFDSEQCQQLLTAPLAAILEKGRARGQFPLADPWADAVSILYLAVGHMGEAMNEQVSSSKDAAELTSAFVLRALTGSPTPLATGATPDVIDLRDPAPASEPESEPAESSEPSEVVGC